MFNGEPVFVLASGPSLTLEDIETVRKSGFKTIAVNSTWEKARFCDVLFAADNTWWLENYDKIDILAARASLSYNAEQYQDAPRFPSRVAGKGGFNSGCIAIEYAVANDAGPVLMLGFDCSVKNGIHHHGKHKNLKNPDAGKCRIWMDQFALLRKLYKHAKIINCSRYTELKVFPRMSLEFMLESLGKSSLHGSRAEADI
jgi:hypothetical protein